MKARLLNVSTCSIQSFSTRIDREPNVNSCWHYHNALELIYFKKGKGTRFIGDNIKRFNEGDIYLIGSNLPHLWRFDKRYSKEDDDEPVEVLCVHFMEGFLGETFLNLTENKDVKRVLELSRQGLQIFGPSKDILAGLLVKIISAIGAKRIVLLIEALIEIAECKQVMELVSLGFEPSLRDEEKNKIQAIYNYTILNYKRKIQVKEIAEVANISRNYFCKYFKSKCGKTYLQFLTEIRIGHACRLLIEDKLSVKEICFECGYLNFTSFHRSFKRFIGKSPLGYQQSFI